MARIVELTDEELTVLETALQEKRQKLVRRYGREEDVAPGSGINTIREAGALARVLETLGKALWR